jgi:hypothetical protein
LTRDRLSWVLQNYIRADTLTRANARLVDYQATLPLAQEWGGGEVASADGLRFVTPVRTINAGPNRKYFGAERGVTYYNFTSDQCTGFHGIVIPGTLRDSLYILEGLLEQQTSLRPTELMTDTAGASDIVFGLFWLLGFQFSPRLADFVLRTAPTGQPFLMYIAPYAPHEPATPAPRHEDAFFGVEAPRTPEQIAQLDALYRKRLQSMLAVEDLVERLIKTLWATRQLRNTYIVFTSDNGYHLGQHRLPAGKNSAYEEDIRVPLIVRGPRVPAGQVVEHLAVNIDLAPTFVELGGAKVLGLADGRSLVPLLRSNPPPIESWRQGFLLEAGFITGNRVFQGIRANGFTFVEYPNTQEPNTEEPERELYDLHADPDQLESLHKTVDPAFLVQLGNWLTALRECAGESCRSAEDSPPVQ